jgi:GT2 family glycosyltransferase
VAVVVVHRPGPWFDETLGALAAQDYPDLRYLFLVAGTPDEAEVAELAGRIRGRIPGAFVRRTGLAGGFGANANEVLRLVEGDNGFFLLCHDDIAPAPDTVRQLVTELYRSNAGMVGPKLVEWDEPRRLQHVGLGLDRFGEVEPLVEQGEVDQEQLDAVRDVFVLPSVCILVRADLFRHLGGYDPSIDFHGDDVELCWRAHLQGARVVVVPDARVRHREALEERRPDLDHRARRARHRLRAVATLTGRSRLVVRSLQLVVLTLVELVIGAFTGRLGEAVASLRALVGLLWRTPSIIVRRRAVAPQRLVPEREVLGLQTAGSARLASYVRARETTTYIGEETTVRRWREQSFGPVLAWFVVLVAVVVGSRTIIDEGVPFVGEYLRFPDDVGGLLDTYRSSWDARGLGATAPVPTGVATLAMFLAATLGRPGLTSMLMVVAPVVIGAAGVWRLATLFPSNRARIVTLVVYVGTPLVPGLLGTGAWSGLVWYGALPWMVHLLRRSVGIGTADPTLGSSGVDLDLVDGIAPVPTRQLVRYVAALSFVLAVATALEPASLPLWILVGVVLAAATLLAGGALRSAGVFLAATAVSSAVAVVLNLPWATSWTWASVVGTRADGPLGAGLAQLASLAVDDRRFAVLGIGFFVPVVAALAITRAWRLTWAIRGAALALVFLSIAVLDDRAALPLIVPSVELLLVPVVLGVALSAGSLAGGFGHDVLGRGFGWRQPLALLASAATVFALVPAAVSIGDGAWGAPRTTLPALLEAQLPEDVEGGGYRVLFLGDPRIIPVASVELRPGIAYAVVDGGRLDLDQRWAPPSTAGDAVVAAAIERIADGSTARAGRLLAPFGIRYVVVPRVDGVTSTVSDPLPVPVGLLEALDDQLDIGEAYGPPNFEIYENRAWIPLVAELGPELAASSTEPSPEAAVAASSEGTSPGPGGVDPRVAGLGAVDAGVLHLAVPLDPAWTLEVDGVPVPSRAAFGVTTAFDVTAAGTAELGHESSGSRTAVLVFQALAWLAVVVASTRTRSPFGRRRSGEVVDETLIDLDEEPGPEDRDPMTARGPVVDPLMRPDVPAPGEQPW